MPNAHWTVRARWWIVLATLLALVLGGILAAQSLRALSLSRFEAQGSEAFRAAQFLDSRFGAGTFNVVLLVDSGPAGIDDTAIAAAARNLTQSLAAEPGISAVQSYWTGGGDVLASSDRRHGLILLRLPGSATESRARLAELSPRLPAMAGPLAVAVGGSDEVFRQTGEEAARDFVRAESIIFPAAFVLLLLIFRNVAAAILPILVGLFAMVGTLATLRLLALVTEVSTFALNLTLVLGLGLGIDYGLFVITRFRDARRDGASMSDAVAMSLATAGRTVVFSGITVAVSLAAMLVFPFPFPRSFGYAGIAVVGFGIVGATVLLPALLAIFGRWVGRSASRGSGGQGIWHRLATLVMRHPLALGGAAMLIVLALGSPVLGLRFGLPDDRILPQEASSRQVQEIIRAGFLAEETDALLIAAPDLPDTPGRLPLLAAYATQLSLVPGVAEVRSAAGRFAGGAPARPIADPAAYADDTATWLSVIPSSERLERDPHEFVAEIRAVPASFATLVGGYPADLTDFRATVIGWLRLVLALIFGATIVILFLMTGSVLLPLKATILNTLSLSVMFGALVFVFQDGNFAGLLGFTPTGTLETSIPILMFCIAYGLSMDYEVFMLSRIKEEHDRTGNNAVSVAAGLEASGPLITAAALILAASFSVYLTSGVVFLKMLGLGTALAILIDATLIRAVLVPAVMRLAGEWNWWAPAPLRRLHRRFGLSD